MAAPKELHAAKAKLKEQLRKISAAEKGLPVDGSVVQTQADIARHFKVQRSTVHDWVLRGMPGEPGLYVISDITAWRETQKDEAELLASASDSPWLEELRKNKALQEQIKLEAMRRSVVQIDKMQDAWGVWSAILKRLGERIGRKYGRDAADMVTDAMDDCDRVLADIFRGHAARCTEEQAAVSGCDDVNGNGKSMATGGTPGGSAKKRAAKRPTRKKPTNQRVGGKRTDTPKRAVQRRKIQAPSASGQPVVVRGFSIGAVE